MENKNFGTFTFWEVINSKPQKISVYCTLALARWLIDTDMLHMGEFNMITNRIYL